MTSSRQRSSRQRSSRQRRSVLAAIFLSIFFGIVTRAGAVTIVLKGKDDPIHGYLVKEDPVEVHVRIVTVSGTQVKVYPVKNIAFINRPLDSDRLSDLTPAKPDDYRQYAEELSDQKVDPEARELATRLFLVAAHLDQDRLGRSCLLGLTNLARTRQEKARCRALAYLLDPEHDRALLERSADDDSANKVESVNEYKALVSIIEAINRGRTRQAQGIAKRHDLPQLLARYDRLLTPEELSLALATPEQSSISPELQVRILRFYHELLAKKITGAKHLAKRPTNKWNIGLLNSDNQEPVRTLALDSITGFDPRESLYRGGKWVRP